MTLMQEDTNPPETVQFTALPFETDYDVPQTDVAPLAPISWTASEFIAHHKSTQWYATLAGVAAAAALVVWLLTKDVTSALVVLFGAGVLGAYGARQPRELAYNLDMDVLSIGAKTYTLDSFRSFTVDDQQAIASVNLMPLKRFAPGLTIYFAPTDEDAIIDLLAQRLPIEEHQPDMIDRLMRHIRF